MEKCSLNNFGESLLPWLDGGYILKVNLNNPGKVVFTFHDGVNDSYEITDCNRNQIRNFCEQLSNKGIAVHGLQGITPSK